LGSPRRFSVRLPGSARRRRVPAAGRCEDGGDAPFDSRHGARGSHARRPARASGEPRGEVGDPRAHARGELLHESVHASPVGGVRPLPAVRVAAMNANIATRLAERAARHPDRSAIVEARAGRRERVSFAELDARAASYAADWRARGIGPGERVLIFVPMSIALYAVLIAAFRVGAVAVFVGAWADRARLERAMERPRPRAFVGVPRAHWLRLVSRAMRGIANAIMVRRGAPRPAQDAEGPATLTAEAPALVTFTTGSTGRPKAAQR